jgi:hypothetical protein
VQALAHGLLGLLRLLRLGEELGGAGRLGLILGAQQVDLIFQRLAPLAERRLLPLDPVVAVLGDNVTQEAYQAMYKQLGLDQPLYIQFGRYLWGVLHLDFGMALTTGKPVMYAGGSYSSPWPIKSITGSLNATAPKIDFHDTSAVICANCHTTINHIAPLFANFDAVGNLTGSIQVITPVA